METPALHIQEVLGSDWLLGPEESGCRRGERRWDCCCSFFFFSLNLEYVWSLKCYSLLNEKGNQRITLPVSKPTISPHTKTHHRLLIRACRECHVNGVPGHCVSGFPAKNAIHTSCSRGLNLNSGNTTTSLFLTHGTRGLSRVLHADRWWGGNAETAMAPSTHSTVTKKVWVHCKSNFLVH